MKTSLGNCIKRLSECVDDLKEFNLEEFDQLRFTLKKVTKTKRKPNHQNVSRYNQLEAELGSKVLSYQRMLTKSIEELEKVHFQQHGQLPTKATNLHYSTLLRNKKLATTVIRGLNIRTLC